jgi:hypothetical protein
MLVPLAEINGCDLRHRGTPFAMQFGKKGTKMHDFESDLLILTTDALRLTMVRPPRTAKSARETGKKRMMSASDSRVQYCPRVTASEEGLA